MSNAPFPDSTPPRLLPRQKVWLALVILVNAALWIVPSNVVELVARDEHTLLGRYSRTHFSWNLAALVISMIGCYIDWSRGPVYKSRWFQVIATVIFLVPALALADRMMRTPDAEHYVRDSLAYRRPANSTFTRTFTDRPNAYRSYPRVEPGFGTVECVLRTDRRGYRNQTDLYAYDIVALGDSFTEGSNVSDEHVWPVRLAELSAKTVYNLGMSGYDPFHYLESLREVGLGLRPKTVLCMVYEGNDFRSTKSDNKRRNPSLSMRLKDYVSRSPLVNRIDALLVETFGPIGASLPLPEPDVVAWMPVTAPADGPRRHYAFEPKQLRDLDQTAEDFAQDKHWLNPRGQTQEMQQLCEQAGAELVIVFAPTKAHVLLPLVAATLPPDSVRSFAEIAIKDELPPGPQFVARLLSRLDAREQVVREFCQNRGIRFVGLTQDLREAIQKGIQVYYTYDQHWTPLGHQVVAETLQRQLQNMSLATRK